ncbi:MAG TPA: MBOAT family protein [Gemmatimonadaceae bacterium]
MLFNSLTFAAFLAIVLPLYYLLPFRWQNRMLLVASYVFYGWWDWRFLFLLALSTVVDFFIAKKMNATDDPRRRRRLMTVSVTLNLCYLGFFKYFDFFAESARAGLERFGVHADFFTLHVLLPVGISFYTFQAISYIVDVYRNAREHTDDFVAFALYLSYFPHLVAGPIQRSTQLLPQLVVPRSVTARQISSGAVLMLVGYFKKVAIADAVAPTVNQIFGNAAHTSWVGLLIGVWLFAAQIYCDFSGYTDIARGVSRLMGVELRINFRQPYFSANITEFWRRWHISLSDWLRDYLYISLGGNRRGKWRTYRNLMLTMLLGGLWHGANWTFVAWGGLHGVYLAVHKMIVGSRKVGLSEVPASPLGWLRFAASVILTFNLVCLTWIFFRAPDFATAWTYLRGIVTLQPGAMTTGWLIMAAFYLALTFLVDLPAWLRHDEQPIAPTWPVLARGLAYGVMLAICLWIGAPHGAPFIYFQF